MSVRRSGIYEINSIRTESLLGLDESHGELAANGDLLQQAGNLKVAAASEISAVDGLDVVTDSNVLDLGLEREHETEKISQN